MKHFIKLQSIKVLVISSILPVSPLLFAQNDGIPTFSVSEAIEKIGNRQPTDSPIFKIDFGDSGKKSSENFTNEKILYVGDLDDRAEYKMEGNELKATATAMVLNRFGRQLGNKSAENIQLVSLLYGLTVQDVQTLSGFIDGIFEDYSFFANGEKVQACNKYFTQENDVKNSMAEIIYSDYGRNIKDKSDSYFLEVYRNLENELPEQLYTKLKRVIDGKEEIFGTTVAIGDLNPDYQPDYSIYMEEICDSI